MRLLVFAGLVLCTQIGCAQYMAIRAPGPIDRNVLQPGAERTKVAGTLGAPKATTDDDPGKVVDTYNYTDGGKKNTALPKAGRVVLYTAGDVFTLFLDQILWIPAEVLMNGTEYTAIVEYRQRASDGQWIAAHITETKLEGDRQVRVLELEPAVVASLAPPPTALESTGTGTCFAVSSDGRLLTAAHVLGGASSTYVVFADGRAFPATLESHVAAFDVALLRVNAETPQHVSLGDAGSLQVGERAFTLGYTTDGSGVVEARLIDGSITSLSGPDGDATYIGIHVPVHPESTGEPLVDARGQVVGIVTATGPLLPVSASTVSTAAPESINHAVSVDFVSPFVGATTPLPPTASFDEAVERTRAALCRVQPDAPSVAAPTTEASTAATPATEASTVATPTTEASN